MKLTAPDGKQRLTDVAPAETLLRLVQFVPSPKAEPIKLWLANVGYERMQEMADPALSLGRARQTWQQHGRSDKWIQQRMTADSPVSNDGRRLGIFYWGPVHGTRSAAIQGCASSVMDRHGLRPFHEPAPIRQR